MSKFLMSLKSLNQWFEKQQRVLPWRNDPSSYRVWISEIMLQQTQVITVIPYFERFIQRFPVVESLAEASEEEVMKYWAGLGYYSRARNLHKGAKKIVEMGCFPKSREEWVEIPGVGPYTAGAILSIANNLAEPILDGNVERVLSRVRRVSRQNGDVEFKKRLWRLSDIVVKTASDHRLPPRNINQALMELGATICTPKNPKCLLCPIQKLCRAFENGQQEDFPPKKKPKQWISIQEELHCVLLGENSVLLSQRKTGEWRAGLWDLLEKSPKEIFPESTYQNKYLGEVETRHIVTRHKILRKTKVWRLTERRKEALWKAAEKGSFQPGDQAPGLKWISLQEPDVAVGSALKKTLQTVLSQFASTPAGELDS